MYRVLLALPWKEMQPNLWSVSAAVSCTKSAWNPSPTFHDTLEHEYFSLSQCVCVCVDVCVEGGNRSRSCNDRFDWCTATDVGTKKKLSNLGCRCCRFRVFPARLLGWIGLHQVFLGLYLVLLSFTSFYLCFYRVSVRNVRNFSDFSTTSNGGGEGITWWK